MSNRRTCKNCGRIIGDEGRFGLCPLCYEKKRNQAAGAGVGILGAIGIAAKNPKVVESLSKNTGKLLIVVERATKILTRIR